jgi:hypothetical protein
MKKYWHAGWVAAQKRLPMAEVLRQCGSRPGLLLLHDWALPVCGLCGPLCKRLRPKRQELQEKFRVLAQLNPRSHHAQPVCWCERSQGAHPQELGAAQARASS